MSKLNRRKFFQICGGYAAGLASLHPNTTVASSPTRLYHRVQLMRESKPLRASSFEEGQVYIFHYPYVTTPCMIMNLGEPVEDSYQLETESGSQYSWQGGVGPLRSIVSYSAICAHQMTYPAKSASFINYRHSKVVYFDENHSRQERQKIIYCCSERSVYDPKLGAKVLGGPAPQPLASIQLDYSVEDDTIAAVGTKGGEKFDEFFTEFEFRLQLDFEILNVSEYTTKQVELMTIEEFSEVIVHC